MLWSCNDRIIQEDLMFKILGNNELKSFEFWICDGC